MKAPSVQYSITIRLEIPARPTGVSEVTTAVEDSGAMVTGLDVNHSDQEMVRIDLTCSTSNAEHAKDVVESIRAVPQVKIIRVSDRTFLAHLGGKIKIESKVPIRNRDDLSLVYTPGVARVCEAIVAEPEDARNLTIKRNTVAVVSDGSAVLGLGNIGPLAALPVMEGKAALFKRFADIDAFPICLDTQDTEEIIQAVKNIAPNFAGINLEDISAPRCFEIEDRLRGILDIPVFHDDQHGTAIVALAALRNALRVVKKDLSKVKIVLSGAGAAGTAILKLLMKAGAKNVVVADVNGVVHKGRDKMNESLEWIAANTNPKNFTGTLKQALKGADVFIGVSAPNVVGPKDLLSMADDPIVFAMANPNPEIDPAVATKYAAVVATGRSDYANQINNVLAFPGFFRGLLDAQSKTITDEMLLAASEALADMVADEQLNANYIIPSVFNADVSQNVSRAVQAAVEATEGKHAVSEDSVTPPALRKRKTKKATEAKTTKATKG
ncbi:MAG: NAD-dependent malic enzyme [Micrococcaceae bacterium]